MKVSIRFIETERPAAEKLVAVFKGLLGIGRRHDEHNDDGSFRTTLTSRR